MAGQSFQNGQTLGQFFEPLYIKSSIIALNVLDGSPCLNIRLFLLGHSCCSFITVLLVVILAFAFRPSTFIAATLCPALVFGMTLFVAIFAFLAFLFLLGISSKGLILSLSALQGMSVIFIYG